MALMSFRRTLLFLLSASIVGVGSQAFGQNAQISEGVRVMAPTGQTAAEGAQYYVNPQPPIFAYMADTKLFDGAAELLKFFRSLPADVQRGGLWITPAGLPETQTEVDRNRMSMLVQEARKQKVLTYVCSATDYGGRSGLVGWECTRRSPAEGSGPLRCIPRDQPHQGAAWWDCTAGSPPPKTSEAPSKPGKWIAWTEDVLLGDGRLIVVKRAEEYRHVVDAGAGIKQGWLLEQTEFSAELPQPIGRRISWRGSLHPVAFDIQPDGAAYLVGVPANGRVAREWKLPRHELYVVLQLTEGKWERVSMDQLPSSIQVNLFASSYRLFITEGKQSDGHVDLELKRKLDSNLEIDRRYRMLVRIPKSEGK